MKKSIIILSGLLVSLALNSCTKMCHCTTYVAGLPKIETDYELDRIAYKQCSDMNDMTIDLTGSKEGVVCTDL